MLVAIRHIHDFWADEVAMWLFKSPNLTLLEDFYSLFSFLDYEEYAVKSQLLAGGRGKGRFIGGPANFGGVQITKE
jgi:succinyl-CoA synthetase beta subunit